MNFKSRITLAAAMLMSMTAFAQSAGTATLGSVSVATRIYVPITLTGGTSLNFGDIFTTAAAGTVTLEPVAGARSATGGATLASTGSTSIASFTVGGKRAATYSITLPSDSSVTLTGPSGATAMPVKTFTASVAGGTATTNPTGLLPNTAGATQTFTVGATLSLAANQTDGNYTGSFPVTVAYN
jgi:hypothetical protein